MQDNVCSPCPLVHGMSTSISNVSYTYGESCGGLKKAFALTL